MRVLVCGSRTWADRDTIRLRLSRLPRDTIVLHGAARGADSIAADEAERLGLTVRAFPADWGRFGKLAGPVRNRRMLDEEPDLVLAFRVPGRSPGTDDLMAEARRRGVPIERFAAEIEPGAGIEPAPAGEEPRRPGR